MTVADIGAGSGYFSFRLARRVGAGGRVLAVDIQDEMLQIIRRRASRRNIGNVEPIRGTIRDPGLSPESVDLALMVDVYHEFSHPWEMIQGNSSRPEAGRAAGSGGVPGGGSGGSHPPAPQDDPGSGPARDLGAPPGLGRDAGSPAPPAHCHFQETAAVVLARSLRSGAEPEPLAT